MNRQDLLLYKATSLFMHASCLQESPVGRVLFCCGFFRRIRNLLHLLGAEVTSMSGPDRSFGQK